ncbi:MAG: hypothetical protein ACPH5P_05110 [Akkermansiaceae bacterium]
MNDNNFEPLKSLISLKRHEQPDDAYFEELLEEFHRRQRQNHLKPSFHKEIMERVGAWFAATNRWNYVAGVGAAYALVFMVVILYWPDKQGASPELPTVPSSYEEKGQQNGVEDSKSEEEKDLESVKNPDSY